MANYGIIVSQPGYDVNDCPDKEISFSSSFETLKTFQRYSVNTTVPSSGTNTITINHNLGFLAPFLVIYNGDSNNYAYLNCDSNGLELTDNIRQYANKLEIDVNTSFDDLPDGATVYFTVYVFYNDFRTISEENINSVGTSGSEGSNYGLAVSKEGYNVLNCLKDQLVFNSNSFNSVIHMQGKQKGSDGAIIEHNLGYIPQALVWRKRYTDSYLTFSSAWAQSNSTYLWVYNTDDNDSYGYYIIFKNVVNG
jgi:hypothetical protein